MNNRLKYLVAALIVFSVVLACTISIGGSDDDLSKEDMVNTSVAQTFAANPVITVDQPTATIPTVEVPTQTQALPTNTPIPCNKAAFISETIPDGSSITFSTSFTKTWRFKNIGTCTWNTNYQLVFYSGDQLDGPAVKNFTQNVKPGETVDISVDLKSPGFPGKYRGYWKLRSDKGEYYINNLWVDIEVKPLVVKVAITLTDLYVPNFIFNPSCAVSVPCTINIEVKNGGGLAADAFTVSWYALSTDANPTKVWNLSGLAAGASQTLTQPWTYGSVGYFSTMVKVDTNNQVIEGNENNNTATYSFTVSP